MEAQHQLLGRKKWLVLLTKIERIIAFYISFCTFIELQKSSGLKLTGRTLWPGPGIFVYSCPAEFNEQRFIKMFVTEDGNTRGRATLRDGHIAVGDVVRYGPCFCFFF